MRLVVFSGGNCSFTSGIVLQLPKQVLNGLCLHSSAQKELQTISVNGKDECGFCV